MKGTKKIFQFVRFCLSYCFVAVFQVKNISQVTSYHHYLFCPRIAFLTRCKTRPPWESSTLELFASITAMLVASAGSLPLTVPSAVSRCPLMASFTCFPEVVKSPSVPAILKATAKTSPGEWCEWDSTLATVQGSVMQTLTRVGTQCPESWWKKYQLHRSKRVLSKNREEKGK